jgi:hemolysin activation/secretion protein
LHLPCISTPAEKEKFKRTIHKEGGLIMYSNGVIYGATSISDMCSWDGTDKWKIETNGHARFARLYLDATRYLFVDSGILYYYNGSTNKQIAFTN